jgi:hypothetical protein
MWLSGGAQATAKLSSQPNTYTGYSIGCAIVWAVILAVTSTKADSATRHTIRLVFGGWVIGWLSATIARTVYPPPKRRNPVA